MRNSLTIPGTFKEEFKKDDTTDDIPQYPPKNYAEYFFRMTRTDYTTIDVTNQRQVTKLLEKNIDSIIKSVFNLMNEGKPVFIVNENTFKEAMGLKSLALITSKYYELKSDVSEVCDFIKANGENPRETLDMIGITYHHGNLPPDCDGLF